MRPPLHGHPDGRARLRRGASEAVGVKADEWLAAVEASDLPEHLKAFCRDLAERVGLDGMITDELLASMSEGGSR